MDTASIPLKLAAMADDVIPADAADAVRQGVRRALELLRPPALPVAIIVTDAGRAIDVLANPSANALADDRIAAIADGAIVVSVRGVERAMRERSLRFDTAVLRYFAGHAGAAWALRAHRLDGQDNAVQIADRLAVAASGFQYVPARAAAEADAAIELFLRRMAEIREKEGPQALWRGELAAMLHDFTERVGLYQEPGHYGHDGERLQPTELLRLLDFIAGKAPWPVDGDGAV